MANRNKKTDELGVDRDDDPTAELEVLPEPLGAKSETHRRVDSRPSIDDELKFEVEPLRSSRTGLEKKIEVLEEALSNIAEEVKEAHEKQFCASELLEKRDNEIKSLRSQLLAKAQDIEELRMSDVPTGGQRTAISDSTSRADKNDELHQFASLVPLDGNASSDHPIKIGLLRLGSGPDNDIHIQSQFISRHHAQIVSNSSNSILDDLNSTNGTYVNSKRIKRHALRNGDSITIGKHRFKYIKPNLDASDYESELNKV